MSAAGGVPLWWATTTAARLHYWRRVLRVELGGRLRSISCPALGLGVDQ